VAYYGARQGVPLPKPTLHDLFDMGPEAVSSVLGAGVLLAASAFAWGNPRIRQVAVATGTAVAPVLFVWLVSRYVGASSFFFFARYLLFCVPAWAVLASAGITAVRSRRALTAVLLIFAVAVLPGQNEMHKTFAHSWYNYPGRAFPPRDYQAAARVIEGRYLRGDVSLTDGQADIDEGVDFYLPADMQLRDLDVRRTSAAVHDILPEWCSDYRACVDRNAQRVWLIVQDHPADPIQGLRPALGGLIAGTYTVSSTFRVTGLTVALLVPRQATFAPLAAPGRHLAALRKRPSTTRYEVVPAPCHMPPWNASLEGRGLPAEALVSRAGNPP
jgi:mannosyltransferase